MKILLSYLLTPFFHLYIFFLIAIFYPIQVVALNVFGDQARRRSVDVLNCLMIKGLYIMGARIRSSGLENIPDNRPLVVVSNHQSMHDISALGWIFRHSYPKFISKIELSRNLLSVSYNLKHGKSAIIDRNKGAQAVKEIFKLGRLIQEHNYAACIFPEGTRSKTGELKPFMTAGLQTLLRAAPSAVVVPFVVKGHSQLLEKGQFPLRFGQKISYTVLEPVNPKDYTIEELTDYLQKVISTSLNQNISLKKA